MISACLGYMVAYEEPLLNLSLQTMLQYPWVRWIVVLDTTTDRPAEMYPNNRVLRYGRDYGHGFDRPVERGGFDEVSARNDLLQRMQDQALAFGCNWLVQCDADEFYTNGLAKQLLRASAAGREAALIECWHACDLLNHVYYEKLHHSHYGLLMNDPHPRAMTVGCMRRFEPNPWLPDNVPNKTLHCLLRFPNDKMYQENSRVHIHVKNMFKDVPDERQEIRPLPLPIEWPEVYKQAWDREWSSRSGYDERYPLSKQEVLIR